MIDGPVNPDDFYISTLGGVAVGASTAELIPAGYAIALGALGAIGVLLALARFLK